METSTTDRQAARQHLGRLLRQDREAARLSGHELAARLGVVQASVSRVETGQQPIRDDLLRRWLDECAVGTKRREAVLAAAKAAREADRERGVRLRVPVIVRVGGVESRTIAGDAPVIGERIEWEDDDGSVIGYRVVDVTRRFRSGPSGQGRVVAVVVDVTEE